MRLYDYGPSCNCYKIRLALAQLSIEYERVPVDIFAGDTLTDEFARINPSRTTPVLETDAAHFLVESAAILMYLADDTLLWPEDRLERAEVLRWLIYEQTEIVPNIGGLRFRLLVGRLQASDADAARRRAEAHRILAQLDGHLAHRQFLVAERYSIADIAAYGYVHLSDEAGLKLGPFPGVRRWLTRVAEQPGYIEDVEPYGDNARPGAGLSLYD